MMESYISNSGSSYDYLFKIIIIGDSGTGKTTLTKKYTTGEYRDNYVSTIGVDFSVRTIDTEGGVSIKLQLWDTAGQERFKAITKNYYKSAHGCIIIYDLTDRESFDNILYWLDQVAELSGESIVKILVGSKADLIEQRQVSREEGQSYAEKYNMFFMEVSSKQNTGVDDLFELMASSIKNKHEGVLSKIPLKGQKDSQRDLSKFQENVQGTYINYSVVLHDINKFKNSLEYC